MFGLGFGEIVIILVLALLLFGPKKLPEVAKQLGKGMRDFQKATEDLKGQFEKEFYADEAKKARPQIVPPPAGAPVAATPSQPVPVASTENVPGLDAALVEAPPKAAAPAAEGAPAPVPPGSTGPA